MRQVFVIAEAGSSHDNELEKAYRLIEAAKECGANAVKFQWTSDGQKMAIRRRLGCDEAQAAATDMYRKYLEKPVSWLGSLKVHADKVGIEFMCSTYLIEDIAVVAPLVKRFKVSAFESTWMDFVNAHIEYQKPRIISINSRDGKYEQNGSPIEFLWCVSKYPCPLDDLKLGTIKQYNKIQLGLSDHTDSTLTGALAVAAGALVVEKHIRLENTRIENPDYRHSLPCDDLYKFHEYVWYIRQAERAL